MLVEQVYEHHAAFGVTNRDDRLRGRAVSGRVLAGRSGASSPRNAFRRTTGSVRQPRPFGAGIQSGCVIDVAKRPDARPAAWSSDSFSTPVSTASTSGSRRTWKSRNVGNQSLYVVGEFQARTTNQNS